MHVKVIVCSDISERSAAKQDGVDVSILRVDKFDPAVMNEQFLSKPRADAYMFLYPDETFEYQNSLWIMTDELALDVGAVYSDKVMRKDNNIIYQFYPPFEQKSKFIYNPTPIFSGKINGAIFNTNLYHLLFCDAINKVGMAAKVIHIPNPLLSAPIVNAKIDEEIKYVWQTN